MNEKPGRSIQESKPEGRALPCGAAPLIHSIAGITTAGTLRVTETGGKLTDLNGGAFDPMRGNALAANRRIHSAMSRIPKNGPDEKRWKRTHP